MNKSTITKKILHYVKYANQKYDLQNLVGILHYLWSKNEEIERKRRTYEW